MSTQKNKYGLWEVGYFVVCMAMILFKLADVGIVKNWSWWWVTAPIWGVSLLGVFIFFLGVLMTAVGKMMQKKKGIPPYTPPRPTKSKFDQRLEDALREAEEKRNAKFN